MRRFDLIELVVGLVVIEIYAVITVKKNVIFCIIFNCEINFSTLEFEASHGAGVQAFDCRCNRLWVRSPLEAMKYLISFIL